MSDAPKPPYVVFEVRPVEDREASLNEGHTVYRDEIYAVVTPAGTRDRLEKIAEEWIKTLEEGVAQERIPAIWPQAYREKLRLFKENQEQPDDGTPLSSMTTITPAQLKNCYNANVRTVEDLADANEEAMGRIGMGGRDLKQKAKAWLDSCKSTGKVSQELNTLRVENGGLKTQLEELQKKFEEVSAKLKILDQAQNKE